MFRHQCVSGVQTLERIKVRQEPARYPLRRFRGFRARSYSREWTVLPTRCETDRMLAGSTDYCMTHKHACELVANAESETRRVPGRVIGGQSW